MELYYKIQTTQIIIVIQFVLVTLPLLFIRPESGSFATFCTYGLKGPPPPPPLAGYVLFVVASGFATVALLLIAAAAAADDDDEDDEDDEFDEDFFFLEIFLSFALRF